MGGGSGGVGPYTRRVMSAPRIVAVVPGSPAVAGRPGRRRRGPGGRRRGAARRDRVALAHRRARPGARPAPGRPGAHRRGGQGRRRAARDRGPLVAVRPGPHVRQPLRVLLHLPAAAGAAEEPVPEGRRLPAELPLRELHHPDPLHRGRPRAGGDRGHQPPEREHPRHRPRGPHRDAAEPARRHQPALAAGPPRPRGRGPRPGGVLPRRQRRCGPRRHPGRRARPVPGAGLALRRPARRQPPQPRAPHAPHHPGRGRGRRRHRAPGPGPLPPGAGPAPGVRGRRVLPPGPPAVPPAPRPTRASPCTRTGWAWPGPSRPSSRASPSPGAVPSATTTRTAPGSRPGSSPGPTPPRPGRATRYEAAGDLSAPAEGYRAVRVDAGPPTHPRPPSRWPCARGRRPRSAS